MRVHLHGDTQAGNFANKLLTLGNVQVPEDQQTGNIKLTSDFCQLAETREELIEDVFPNFASNYRIKEWLCERAILAPTNDMVDKINSSIQDKIV